MPRLRKYFEKNRLYEISFRTEEGLPYIPNELVNKALEGIIAKAVKLYPLSIGHHVFMLNHVHMQIRATNPKNIDKFVMYIKRESAHFINLLLSRKKKTVWCEGYDSVPILDIDNAIDRIVYILLNPVKAHYCTEISKYPGLNTWHYLKNSNKQFRKQKRIPRSLVPKIKNGRISPIVAKKIWEKLYKEIEETNDFEIDINDWYKAFGVTEKKEIEYYNKKIIDKVTKGQNEYFYKCVEEGKGFHTKDSLLNRKMNANYTPKKYGKRMICFASSKDIRVHFIYNYKRICAQAKEAYQKWLLKDYSVSFPPGTFSPLGFVEVST